MSLRRATPIPCLALLAVAVLGRIAPARADDGRFEAVGAAQRRDARPVAIDPPAPREVEDDGARADDLQLGAVVGLGFPRPLAIELMMKVQRLVTLGVEYSLLPRTTISDVDTSFWAVAGDMRVFPFRNGFFVGLRAGRQHLAADTTLIVREQNLPIAAAIETTFVNPRVGLLWTWRSGITLGIDAGLQIPVSSRASGALAAADMIAVPAQAMSAVDQVREVAEYLGSSTIPTVDLLRVGLLL